MARPENHGPRRPPEPPREPVPTLEALWGTYGSWLQAYARRALGDDRGTVEAGCFLTMVRAGHQLLSSPESPGRGADLSWWLQGIADDAFAEIRRSGVDPAWVPDAPLPEGFPAWLRVSLRMRAEREAADIALEREGARGPIGRSLLEQRARLRAAFEDYLRRFPVVVLLPRRAWRALGHALDSTRTWWRRTEAELVPLAGSSTPRLGLLLVGNPVLSEVAALTGVVVVALGIGAPAMASPGRPQATLAVSAAAGAGAGPVALHASPAREVPVTSPAPTGATREQASDPSTPTLVQVSDPSSPPARASDPPPPAPTSGPSPAAPKGASEKSPTPASDPDPLPAVPVAPRVSANPGEAAEEPVKGEPYKRGVHYETPGTRVSVDADGDGEDEASIATPVVFVDCPSPERRGVVMGAACPVLEESGVGE